MKCNRCLLTDDIVNIRDGVCDFCRIHDELEKSDPAEWDKMLAKIKRKKGFQVITGLSGGVDSCFMLHYFVTNGINPLVVHFDNGYNSDIAERNMKLMVEKLGVTLIRYSIHKTEYDLLNEAFINAGVPEADIPNDMAMTAIIMELADRYRIKYVINGHDFRNEGSTPIKWTYMDAKYVQSVFRWYTGTDLVHFPLLTFGKQILYAIKGIKQLRPFNYYRVYEEYKKTILKHNYGWEEYPNKHGENTYTEWVGYDYLPNNFGIDKRLIYLSAQVRSGFITEGMAQAKLSKAVELPFKYNTFKGVHRTHADFETYNFKAYKPLLWVLMRLKLIHYLFYKKYTE